MAFLFIPGAHEAQKTQKKMKKRVFNQLFNQANASNIAYPFYKPVTVYFKCFLSTINLFQCKDITTASFKVESCT